MISKPLALGIFFAFSLLLESTLPCEAEDRFPNSIAGLLKPGTLLSINEAKEVSSVSLNVYSERQYSIAKDFISMNSDALQAKYPEIEQQIEKRLADGIAAGNGKLRLSDLAIRLVRTSKSLAVVKYVGDDYVMIQREGDSQALEAIAIRYISRIQFDSPGFHIEVLINQNNRSGPSP